MSAAMALVLAGRALSAVPGEAEQAIAAGKKAQAAGKTAEALERYASFLAAAPADERAPWILIQVGDLHARRKELKEALQAYAKVTAAYPDAVEARMARSRLVEQGEAAVTSARADAGKAASEGDRQRALWDVASAEEWMGRPRDAAAQYREIKAGAADAAWRKRAGDRLAALVAERVEADRTGPPVPSASRWAETAEIAETAEAWDTAAAYHVKLADLSADPGAKLDHQLAAARSLQISGKPERALELYRAAAKSAAAGGRAEEVVRSAGMALEGMRRYGEALRLYTDLLPRDRPAWARLRVAFCRERIGDDEAALTGYREITDRPDGQSLAPDALLGISRILERRKEFEAARPPLQRVLDEYASSPRAAEARLQLASLAAKAQEWDALRQELERMAAKYPRRERRTGE